MPCTAMLVEADRVIKKAKEDEAKSGQAGITNVLQSFNSDVALFANWFRSGHAVYHIA